MSVNTNVAALNSYRNLSVTNDQMSKSLERLSSGFRINRAADDAAGLAISEGLRSQIGGMKQAVRNTQDGISVVQTAEGALSTSTSILQRMRDLSVQASNAGSLNDSAKANIQKEVGQLKEELSRISSTTNFNGTKLLDGSYSGTFQVGADAGQSISVTIGGPGKGMDAAGLGVNGVDVTGVGLYTNAASGTAAGTVVTTAATSGAAASLAINKEGSATVDTFSGASGSVAAYEKLTGTISFGGKTFDLSTVDYTGVTGATATDLATNSLAALNSAAKAAFGLASTAANPFTATATALTFATPASVAGYTDADGALSGSAADIAKATPVFTAGSGATQAIKDIDAALQTVSSIRADLGAKQNRFEHTINNLNVAVENTTASESRIRDTDMAQEMTNFTRTQILTQAGTAMLSQANQASQGILRLLG
ncbi:flagellin [Blastococcus sp. BMG 814]|uniref:Flagellin n=1 Tax=Blastococcus carthaginiensis TaxID=3050034 RepID=A0ABT9IFF7_9ACTN|nr:flagellin [Blastococcus carthaginiensis]MDP5184309.1 flagellin [Blastococcus carthaginiensis]